MFRSGPQRDGQRSTLARKIAQLRSLPLKGSCSGPAQKPCSTAASLAFARCHLPGAVSQRYMRHAAALFCMEATRWVVAKPVHVMHVRQAANWADEDPVYDEFGNAYNDIAEGAAKNKPGATSLPGLPCIRHVAA